MRVWIVLFWIEVIAEDILKGSGIPTSAVLVCEILPGMIAQVVVCVLC